MTYGQWLAGKRHEVGLTAARLEEMAGLGEGNVARYEQGRRYPRQDSMLAIQRVLVELGATTLLTERLHSQVRDAVAWFEHPDMRTAAIPDGLRQVLTSMRYELYGPPYAPVRQEPALPGQVLLAELVNRGVTEAEVADRLGVGRPSVSKLLRGQRFSPWVGLQLEAVLGGRPSAEFFCNLQRDVDLHNLREVMQLPLRQIRPL